MTQKLHATLFFTSGVSLQTWKKTGMFSREVALYQRLQERGVQVAFVTYGDSNDLSFESELPGIQILCNRWGLPVRIYRRLIPFIFASTLRRTSVIKTNQANGGNVAHRTAKVWRKPLIARCGYLYSLNTARQYGDSSQRANRARDMESRLFRSADHIIVTTEEMANSVRAVSRNNPITVIPNYVDTGVFHPLPSDKDVDLVFVGRLSDEKNIEALLTAAQKCNASIRLIGGGMLADTLKAQFPARNGELIWQGNVPNEMIAEYMNRAKVFILPSRYEGHPKTLIEAMACGMPVIGTDVPGIREQIQHGETGWLCQTDSESIAEAIQKLLSDTSLREKMGRNARQYAIEHFSLDYIVEKEMAVLTQVTEMRL